MYRKARLWTYKRMARTVAEEEQTAREGDEATQHNKLVKGKKRQKQNVPSAAPPGCCEPTPHASVHGINFTCFQQGEWCSIRGHQQPSLIIHFSAMLHVRHASSERSVTTYREKSIFPKPWQWLNYSPTLFPFGILFFDRNLMVWLEWKQELVSFCLYFCDNNIWGLSTKVLYCNSDGKNL